MDTYYVVLLDGLPVGVSLDFGRARQTAKEMETSSRKAVIIPTLEITREQEDFNEEPTLEDIPVKAMCACQLPERASQR
jgi:hypothetical protein